MSEFEYSCISLNSMDRKYNSSLSNPIFITDNITNITGYKLKNFVCALTSFNIDSHNNKFLIEFAGNDYTLTITPTNYTTTTLFNVFDSFLFSVFGSGNYGIAYNSSTYKWNITSSVGNFIIKPVANNCYYELGISDSQLSVATNNLLSANNGDLSGIKLLSIVCPSFQTKYKTENNYNIIGNCVIDETLGTVISYIDNSNDYISTNVSSLNTLSFLFLDERQRIVNIKNDYVLTIMFQTT